MAGPAYRIETERLLLRCWNPEDAPLLHTAVAESFEHLRPRIPWMKREPLSLEERVAVLRGMRSRFDRDEDFSYAVFEKGAPTRVVGGVGLHLRSGPDSLEVGYWVHVAYTRRGFGAEMAAAASRVGLEVHGVSRIELNCVPDNVGSVALARSLGFRHEATLPRRFLAVLPDSPPKATEDKLVFSLYAADLATARAGRYPVSAWDARGAKLLE